jgi:hypothetical protein
VPRDVEDDAPIIVMLEKCERARCIIGAVPEVA